MSNSSKLRKMLPKTLKILGITYDVKEFEDHIMNKEAGFTHPHGSLISITTGMKPNQKANTFLHEVIHAVFAEMGMQNTTIKDQEEYIVECITNGLCSVIRDNPKLIAFLQENLSGSK